MGDGLPPHQALVLGEYSWIVVVGAFAAFIFGYGTGSNDVANAFGTSVGSKTLTLKQAVLIAIIFEFTGALVLGRVSQETISGGIADISAFSTDPEFFAYGMMWALMVGGVWQILASHYELNVSATHSIIGAVVGFAMAYKGSGSVIWAQEQIVCTGPLTFLNPCEGVVCAQEPEALMFKPSIAQGFNPNGQFLGATFTVPLSDLYNQTTGTLISPPIVTVSYLMYMTGLNITLVSENVASNGTITNYIQPQPVKTPSSATFYVNLPGYGDPLQQNATDRKVFFTLKTATFDGQPMDCGGLNCPITPQKTAPAVPFQMMYENKAPFCTTSSNSNAPFPPYKGVLIIVLSWFFSPVLTGIASAILFNLARFLVLRHDNSYKRSFFVLPFMSFLTFWVNIYFVLTKGAAKLLSKEAEGWTTVKAGWICAAVAGGISFLSIVLVAPLLYHRVNTTFLKKQEEAAAEAKAVEDAAQAAKDREEKGEPHPEADEHVVEKGGIMGFLKNARNAAMHGVEADVFHYVEDDPLVAAIHKNAEVFDEKAEMVFSYMQVFSAICVIFAHGAGEVGYMSGPLGAIWQVVRTGALLANSSPPIWTVVVGALGLVIGLATYGYQLTGAMGSRLAKLTPSRGFAAELATSMIIMIASQYGLPTSSSQCITGGIIGVALCEGKTGLNYKYFLETFSSWIITMIAMALMVAFLFAQGAYAPSVQMSRIIGYYEEALTVRAELLLRGYQNILARSGYATTATSSTGDVFATYLAQTISNVGPGTYYNYVSNPPGFYPHTTAPAVQTPAPWQMVGYLDTALALLGTVVAANPYGLMMCSASNGKTAYENNKANFPWYRSMASSTPATGPCSASGNTLLSPLPPTNFISIPAAPSYTGMPGSTLCLADPTAPLPACTGPAGAAAAGEQDWTAIFPSTFIAAQATLTNAYNAASAAVRANVTAFSSGYLTGANASIILSVPAMTAPTMPTLGTTICVPAGGSQPPACSSPIADGETDVSTAVDKATAAFTAVVNTANATFVQLRTNAASFVSAVNNVPASTYRSNVINAVNRTFTYTLPPLTLAQFLGPNPACPPIGATAYSCMVNGTVQSRFVDSKGKPTEFLGDVKRLFDGRDITKGLDITKLPTARQGSVTLDQVKPGNAGASVTIFGQPELLTGPAVCMQPPCYVAYGERPWFVGR